MKEVIKSVLNRGAPIDTPIMFNVKEFLEIFENIPATDCQIPNASP